MAALPTVAEDVFFLELDVGYTETSAPLLIRNKRRRRWQKTDRAPSRKGGAEEETEEMCGMPGVNFDPRRDQFPVREPATAAGDDA